MAGVPPGDREEDPSQTSQELAGEYLWVEQLPELPPEVEEQPALPGASVEDAGWEPLKLGFHPKTKEVTFSNGITAVKREHVPKNKLPDVLVDEGKLQDRVRPGRQRVQKRYARIRWDQAALTGMLKKALAADDGYWARRVVNGLILRAAKGNPAAQKIVWERCEGLLKEKVEFSGEVTLAKQVILADIRDKPELPALDIPGEVKRGAS